jgi:hypothetical protein
MSRRRPILEKTVPPVLEVSVLGRALNNGVQDLGGDNLGVSRNLPGSTEEERAGVTRYRPNERGT